MMCNCNSGRKPFAYFYIVQNGTGQLLHGVAVGDGHSMPPMAMWRSPTAFDWARRFSTVDNAIKFAGQYGLAGYSVIDRAGRTLYTYTGESEVRKDALALLKAQEHPTDECIRNAIFCLQNPHDCLETEVEEARKMALCALKTREPKMVTGVAEIYEDILVGNCPSCGQTIVSNVKKPTKYCRFCGQGVTFE